MGKFCSKCGNELPDNAALCVKCGNMIGETTNNVVNKESQKKDLPTWAIILIVVGGVVVVGIICMTILITNLFKVGSEFVEENADKIINEAKEQVEEQIDEDTLNEYLNEVEEKVEETLKENQ